MVTTRSEERKRANDHPKSWSNLNPDLLVIIMMHLGVFDYIALSGVCNAWRSVAVSNWNKFMVSKQPMYLSISDRRNNKECYIEDYTRRKLKTMIPHSNGRLCVGLTCGYLIFFGRKTRDFWLVNPFTRKELHFPGFPRNASVIPSHIRGILVFSPSVSGWVFVVLAHRFFDGLAFSLAGKQAKWTQIFCNSSVLDLHYFKGKIYTMNEGNLLCELRLSPVPTFSQYKMKNFPSSNSRYQEFVSSGEKLYVMHQSGYRFYAVEVNLDEMEWMNTKGTIEEYAMFLSDFKWAAIKPNTWAHPWTQYRRFNYADDGLQSKKKSRCLTTDMWYFPHECLIDNADMKNGALMNTLEEDEEDEKNTNRISCKVLIC